MTNSAAKGDDEHRAESGHATAAPTLARTLGLGQITASGVGIIIGAGIYVLLGAATAEAGSAVWAAFVVAGALSALTALSYAELASMFPKAGAEYDYTRRVAPEWVAFVVGWVMILGLIIAAAAVALGFSNYARYFFDVPQRVAAWGLLGVVTAVALVGMRNSARLTVVLSVLQVGSLGVIVAIGVPHLGEHSLVDGSTPAGVISAAALVFFAFVGFDEVITLAEETTDPARTVPRALLIALGVSTLLYVAVAIAAVSVLGPVALAASDQPLADVMAAAIGSRSADVVAAVAMIATTNTTLLAVTAASRLQYGMAETGALPARFGSVSARHAPWFGILCSAAVAACFVAIGDLHLVASVTDFSVYLVFVAVNASVILLRIWQPKRHRPFTIRGTFGRIPLVPVLALGAIALLMPSLERSALVLGLGVCIAGIGVHVGLRTLGHHHVPTSFAAEDPLFRRTHVTDEESARVADALHIDFSAVAFDFDQFHLGMSTEIEHGRGDPETDVTDDDLITTGKIALAHLNGIPDYYTRLAAMEAEARKR